MTTPDLTSTPKFKLKYSSSNAMNERLNCRKKKKKTEMNEEGGICLWRFSATRHMCCCCMLLLLFFGHGSIDLYRNWSTFKFLKQLIDVIRIEKICSFLHKKWYFFSFGDLFPSWWWAKFSWEKNKKQICSWKSQHILAFYSLTISSFFSSFKKYS